MWNMVSLYISCHVKMTGKLTAMKAEWCAFFLLGLEEHGGEIPEEYRRGDAARGGRQSAGDCAEKALLRYGLFHALGKRAA